MIFAHTKICQSQQNMALVLNELDVKLIIIMR